MSKRYDTNPHHSPPRVTYEEAMMFWRARDLYRLERTGYGVLGTLWLLMMSAAVLKGRPDGVLALLFLPILVLWGVPWLLRCLWRGLRAWWRQLVLAVVLIGLFTGCEESARAMARLYELKGDPFPGPCAAESVQVGDGVPIQQQVSKP
jgi:hypothetical protein